MTFGLDETNVTSSIWRNRPFRAYLSGTAFTGLAFAMQQLLLSWILVGILELPANQVGLLQAVIGVPAIFVMLLGGARSDNSDPRRLLSVTYLLAPIFPLTLIALHQLGYFNVATVLFWGLGVSLVQALSMPAQQAILNGITGGQVQRGVTAATGVGFIVQVIGLMLAAQIDQVGVVAVLGLQAVGFALAAVAILRIPGLGSGLGATTGAWMQVLQGLQATLRDRIIFNVLVINFVSSIFNAGSFMTVFPFIVKRVYAGDAFALGALMALFFTGASIANAILLKFMPLRRPGRVYLLMQLSRIIVLAMLYVRGDWWLLVLGTFLWGMNMGVTSNLARTIVQESAEADFRGRILAVFTVSMVGSAPVGAVLLGWIIESFGTLTALLPAMLVSVLLAAYGRFFTGIWRYRSVE